MKIIGITGKAGAGKTTLSNILAENENVKIIHLDYLLDNIKDNKILQNVTTQNSRKEGDKQHESKLLKEGISNFIYNHAFILKIYLNLKRKIKNRILKNSIKSYNNTDILIIEGFDLLNFEISKKLDLLVLMKVAYNERINRLSKRNEKINKKRIIEIDRNLHKNLIGKNRTNPDYIVENDGDIEDLKEQSKVILKKLEDKTISSSERFRKEHRISRFRIKSPISLTKKNNEERRIKDNDKEIYED